MDLTPLLQLITAVFSVLDVAVQSPTSGACVDHIRVVHGTLFRLDPANPAAVAAATAQLKGYTETQLNRLYGPPPPCQPPDRHREPPRRDREVRP